MKQLILYLDTLVETLKKVEQYNQKGYYNEKGYFKGSTSKNDIEPITNNDLLYSFFERVNTYDIDLQGLFCNAIQDCLVPNDKYYTGSDFFAILSALAELDELCNEVASNNDLDDEVKYGIDEDDDLKDFSDRMEELFNMK